MIMERFSFKKKDLSYSAFLERILGAEKAGNKNETLSP